MVKQSRYMRKFASPKPKGRIILAVYNSSRSAKARVAKLKRMGYTAVAEVSVMGSHPVSVSQRYFRDHPNAKSHTGRRWSRKYKMMV